MTTRQLGWIRLGLLVLCSYGMLYYAYKFYVPWWGGNDFARYYAMYRTPLDFSVAEAPFVFRQLSALLTHAILELKLYYPTEIQFQDPQYDQRVFFAALLANYLCLVATAWLSGYAVEIITGRRSLIFPLLAGVLCFLSFYGPFYVVTGMTEGLSWLMLIASFVAYLRHGTALLFVLLALAVLQRETILIVFAIISACSLWLRPEQRRFDARILGWTILCIVAYVLMRKLAPVAGYENQTQLGSAIETLRKLHINGALIFQGLLSQNIAFLCLAGGAIAGAWKTPKRFWGIALFAAFIVLLVAGLASGIGNNVGRICGILTPAIAVFCTLWLRSFETTLSQTNE